MNTFQSSALNYLGLPNNGIDEPCNYESDESVKSDGSIQMTKSQCRCSHDDECISDE